MEIFGPFNYLLLVKRYPPPPKKKKRISHQSIHVCRRSRKALLRQSRRNVSLDKTAKRYQGTEVSSTCSLAFFFTRVCVSVCLCVCAHLDIGTQSLLLIARYVDCFSSPTFCICWIFYDYYQCRLLADSLVRRYLTMEVALIWVKAVDILGKAVEVI